MDELLIAEGAEDDYTASLRWYAERSTRAANGFDAEFARALTAIAADPDRYPLCDARHRFYLLKRYPFQIIYRKAAEDRWLIVDLSRLVGKGVFQLWNDPEAFGRVSLGTGGELVWSDEVDLCADALYLEVTGRLLPLVGC